MQFLNSLPQGPAAMGVRWWIWGDTNYIAHTGKFGVCSTTSETGGKNQTEGLQGRRREWSFSLRVAPCLSQLSSNNQIWPSLSCKHFSNPTTPPSHLVPLVEFFITQCLGQGLKDSSLSILWDLFFIPMSMWSQENTRDLESPCHSILGQAAPQFATHKCS